MSTTLQAVIGIIAIVLGPVTAIIVSLWIQQRRAKRESKERLFSTLMAHRRSYPPTYEWASALNLIDVVYADHDDVVKLWHEHYDLLCSTKEENVQGRNHKYLELLSAMAKVLGYKKLDQVSIDKFYQPSAHGNYAEQQATMAIEWIRVLQNTERFIVESRKQEEVPEPPEYLKGG
jgi:hypothetical protein